MGAPSGVLAGGRRGAMGGVFLVWSGSRNGGIRVREGLSAAPVRGYSARMNARPLPRIGLLFITLAACASDFAWRDAPDDAATLAWVRFDGQTYHDVGYQFLGTSGIDIRFDVAPAPGQSLDLRWGAKKDRRGADIVVGSHTQRVEAGGHDGFRWLRVPVPAGLTGESVTVRLREAPPKAAFVAEARLVGAAATPSVPDLKTVSHRAKATIAMAGAGPAGEAFPEMRAAWDREPPPAPAGAGPGEALFRAAERNGRQANEALYRSRRFIDGWLAHADPATGLIPRNLRESRDFWNGRDAAADNYPFMVLTAAMTDRPLFEGRMLEMLRTETRLTPRVDRLPDDYSFSRKGWRRETVDLDAIIFDGAEYVKDGLLPITEWLGPSPWSERAIGIIDDIWKHAPVDTPFGRIPTLNFEVNGDLLQACARLFWFTGDRKYLDWAIRLGDYYLLGDHHPTRDAEDLKLGDHSCEVINGLSELYVACAHAAPAKREAYRAPLHELYETLLRVAVNEHGLVYLRVNPKTGAHGDALTDNWGYNFDGLYTAYLLDGTAAYRDIVRKALGNLKAHYSGQGGMCQSSTADGYADSIEGAITLYNRERVGAAVDWIDAEIRTMWAKQKADGVIEGWHGDGNSARTSLMYALWKTQGATIRPWRADVRFGAVADDAGRVRLTFVADGPWDGVVVFDRPRHRERMKLPLDYPRINQFPEWFTVREGDRCTVRAGGDAPVVHSGRALRDGLPLKLTPGVEVRWVVEAASPVATP